MPRAFFFLLLLFATLVAPANAGSRPQVSGDPLIDAQWAGQLRGSAAVHVPSAARPRNTPARAVRAPAKPRAKAAVQAPPRVMDPAFLPSVVPDPTGEAAGTIVIDTHSRHLYLVLEG